MELYTNAFIVGKDNESEITIIDHLSRAISGHLSDTYKEIKGFLRSQNIKSNELEMEALQSTQYYCNYKNNGIFDFSFQNGIIDNNNIKYNKKSINAHLCNDTYGYHNEELFNGKYNGLSLSFPKSSNKILEDILSRLSDKYHIFITNYDKIHIFNGLNSIEPELEKNEPKSKKFKI